MKRRISRPLVVLAVLMWFTLVLWSPCNDNPRGNYVLIQTPEPGE